jgi:alpha-L-fucosidase
MNKYTHFQTFRAIFLSLFLGWSVNCMAIIDDVIQVQSIVAGDSYQYESVKATHLISMEGVNPNPTFDLENTTYAMIPSNCWHTSSNNNSEAWLLLDLGKVIPVSKMYIWNLNQSGNGNRDIKDVTVSYSADNETWQALGDYVIPKSAGDGVACKAQTNIDILLAVRYIKIQAKSSYGDGYWGLGKIILLQDHSQSSDLELARLELKAKLLTVKAYKFYEYSDASWQSLVAAINMAQALLDNESENEAEIAAANLSLQDATTGLVAKSNLVSGATVSASSFYSAGYEASNAADGNFGTRWASLQGSSFWCQIDLKATKHFNQVAIFETPQYVGRIYSVTVSVSNDGTNWVPWREKGCRNYYTSVVGEAVDARYIKIEFPVCNKEGINVDEIMVFDDVSAMESADPTPMRPDDPSWIVQQPGTTPNEYQIRKANLKYGMFLHYGINTFVGEEWTDGSYPESTYHPNLETLDPESWVKAAYEGGMNFVVLVTKHHDGFALWNTAVGTYNINNTGREGDQRDIVKEVSDACKKYGIQMGLYYSAWDRNWDRNHPINAEFDRVARDQQYNDYALAQITELLDGRYGEVCEFWIDGAWVKKNDDWEFPRLYNTVKTLQPACQFGINITIEDKLPNQTQGGENIYFFPSDFRLWDPNFTRPGANADPKVYTHQGKEYYLPFEATICLNNSWFWSSKQNAASVKSAAEIKKGYNHMVEQSNTLVINLSPNQDGVLNSFDIDGLNAGARALGIDRDATPIETITGNAPNRVFVSGQQLFLESSEASDISIYDITGTELMKFSIRPKGVETVDVANFQGIYLVKFANGNKDFHVVKVII